MKHHLFLPAILGVVLAFPTMAQGGGDAKIDPVLVRAILNSEDGKAPMFVYFGERANLSAARRISDLNAKRSFVNQSLQATAAASQRSVANYLRGLRVDFTSYWINNSIYLPAGDLDLARNLARRPEVAYIERELIYAIPPVTADAGIQAVEWGGAKIRADVVWSSIGVRGAGVKVGNIDTGVRATHVALDQNYSGQWKDPSGACSQPCDTNGHGTHTMGTMVGEDGINQIGIAPDAQWAACRGCTTSSCSSTYLMACLQWFAGTDTDIINNSWGSTARTSTYYQTSVNNLVSAGKLVVFSNGNSGPNCDTSGTPANYPNAFAVGATDSADNIASFSSRGPAPSTFGSILKPEVSAPGVSVRSSYRTSDTSYASLSGTSMAAPHVAGAAALLWSARRALKGNIATTRQILQNSAFKLFSSQGCGGLGSNASPNNVFGAGRIDIKAAIDSAGGVTPNQPPLVTITAPANGSTHNCGVAVSFTGTATDAEDGDRTAQLSWTDNGAAFGTGGSPAKTFSCTTEVGLRAITAGYTDTGGLADTETINITIVNPATPGTPSGLTVTKSGSNAVLAWAYAGSGPDKFKVYRRQKARSWTAWTPIATSTTTGYTESPGNGTFQYYVTAVIGTLESGPSNTVQVKF